MYLRVHMHTERGGRERQAEGRQRKREREKVRETIKLEESKEGYMAGFEERRKKRGVINYIIISKNKRNN